MSDLLILSNRYQLTELLGSGGMAVVYRAYDRMLERTVAIKLLREHLSGDPAFRERFRQEAKAAASLSHPNIVTIYDFGVDAYQIFIVMEYVQGADLKELLHRSEQLTIEQAVDLAIQACAGIGHAHAAGLVHCDVKPQNMLIPPDNRLKVVDFGIARAMTSIRPDEKHEIVWGSPQYFSPEQAAGLPPSPASDVYSLGIVLFEALTGQLPFSAQAPEELGRLHRDTLPPSLRRIKPSIPVQLVQVTLKALSKEPSKRFRTALEFGDALSGVDFFEAASVISMADNPLPELSDAQVEAAPTALPGRSSLQLDWITWLLALLALIVFGGLVPFWLWIYFSLNSPF